MVSRDLKKSILVPIIFFSWFKFPLTLKELKRYLWKQELTEEELGRYVREIPAIKVSGGYLSYGGNMRDRADQADLAKILWQKVEKWRWLFSIMPFIRQVYVTNTLSYDNVHANSDIDLFIVAQAGHLWTARLFLLVGLNLLKLRVRSTDRFAKFSPEFLVSDKAMDLKPLAILEDYYLSYWLADMVPIWPDGEHRQFRPANIWAQADVPAAWRSPKIKRYHFLHPARIRLILEELLQGRWGKKLEEWAYSKQRKIIEKNIKRIGVNPSVVTSRDIIKLHFNDRRALVRDAINQTLHDLLAKNK